MRLGYAVLVQAVDRADQLLHDLGLDRVRELAPQFGVVQHLLEGVAVVVEHEPELFVRQEDFAQPVSGGATSRCSGASPPAGCSLPAAKCTAGR